MSDRSEMVQRRDGIPLVVIVALIIAVSAVALALLVTVAFLVPFAFLETVASEGYRG